MSFLFRHYSLINAIYLLIRSTRLGSSCETQIILTENGINKQHTNTHTHTKNTEEDNTGKG